MNRSVATLLGIFMVATMALAVPSVRAHEEPEGFVDNDGNRIVFSTGSLTAEFEGMRPKVKFYDHNEVGRTEHKVNFRALVEFADSGDKIFQSNEEVARVTIDEAPWTHSGFYLLEGGVGVAIDFTSPNLVIVAKDNGGTVPLQAGSIKLIIKAYNTTQTVTVGGKSVTITSAEIKIDVVIKDWPFQNSSNMLALQVNLQSSSHHFDVHESSGSHDFDASRSEGSEVPEHEFHETPEPEEEIRFSSGLITTSTTVGFFRFVDTATVTPAGGQSYSMPVTASYKSGSEMEHGETESFFKLYLAYPNFQGTLVHDPSIGFAGGAIPTLYFIVGGAAVAGLVTVLAIRRRHPKVDHDSELK